MKESTMSKFIAAGNSGVEYLIMISNKKYKKLFAIQTEPVRAYYFKDKEISAEKLIEILNKVQL
jgi:hypothetical protein